MGNFPTNQALDTESISSESILYLDKTGPDSKRARSSGGAVPPIGPPGGNWWRRRQKIGDLSEAAFSVQISGGRGILGVRAVTDVATLSLFFFFLVDSLLFSFFRCGGDNTLRLCLEIGNIFFIRNERCMEKSHLFISEISKISKAKKKRKSARKEWLR